MNPVAITGLLVAAIRAEESKREDRLFFDPFAHALACDEGHEALHLYRDSSGGMSVPIIEVRTRWYDEALLRLAGAGARQFVILAAGMDARSYRLEWPEGTRVFELDQPDVIAAKARVLDHETPRCERTAIGVDLADDWSQPLLAQGFDARRSTVWMVEGLLQYLEAKHVEQLFARLDALSASGSVALYDVIGRLLLDSPPLAATREMMQKLGAPWVFGTDTPGALLTGWNARVTEPAVVGNEWKRWPFPATPPEVEGVPRGYLVEAKKP